MALGLIDDLRSVLPRSRAEPSRQTAAGDGHLLPTRARSLVDDSRRRFLHTASILNDDDDDAGHAHSTRQRRVRARTVRAAPYTYILAGRLKMRE